MHTDPPKYLYIIRHGETDYNRLGVVQGSGVDAPLNEAGRQQAAAFFEAYRHIPFDAIYISALQRTRQSVQAFIDSGIPTQVHAGLNEISWGHMEGKVPNYTEDDYYRHMIQAWRNGQVEVPAHGGESPLQVRQRQEPVMAYIAGQPEQHNVLICMHGRAMRILLTGLMNQPLSLMDTYPHSNLCLYLIRYENGQFSIERANDTAHLAALEPQRS